MDKPKRRIVSKNETAGVMVEFALTFILFIMIVFAVIDFSWVGFQRLSFDYSYQMASWNIYKAYDSDGTQYVVGHEAKNLIRNNIAEGAVGLKKENLKVDNAKITLSTEKRTITNPDSSKQTERRRHMDIVAKVSYTIMPLTPLGEMMFGEKIVMGKELRRHRLLSVKTTSGD